MLLTVAGGWHSEDKRCRIATLTREENNESMLSIGNLSNYLSRLGNSRVLA